MLMEVGRLVAERSAVERAGAEQRPESEPELIEHAALGARQVHRPQAVASAPSLCDEQWGSTLPE